MTHEFPNHLRVSADDGDETKGGIERRDVLRATAMAGIAGVLGAPSVGSVAAQEEEDEIDHAQWPEPEDPYEYAVARDQYERSMSTEAKLMASAVFMTGRDPEEYIHNDVIDHTPLFFDWDDVEIEIDEENQLVTLLVPRIPPVRAQYNGDQGATILPRGAREVAFDPVNVPRNLPNPDQTDWPMGDQNAEATNPDVDQEGLEEALDYAFEPSDETASDLPETRGVVVVCNGNIVAERYADGFDMNSQFEIWSMTKSVTATLFGILVQQGHFDIEDYVYPYIDSWKEDEPRSKIKFKHLLHMAGGLRYTQHDEDLIITRTTGHDHWRIYTEALDIYEQAEYLPLEHEPGEHWAYRNANPLNIARVMRDFVEENGYAGVNNFLRFPQAALFDQIGCRDTVLEPDMYGNIIPSGFNYMSARDNARFGLLHLQDGRFNGKQLLSPEYADFLRTGSPANENYGGLFWVNTNQELLEDVPEDTYYAAGFHTNRSYIVPSHDVVIARHGRDASHDPNTFVRMVLDAVE